MFSAILAEAASIILPSSCAAPLPSAAALSNSSKIRLALFTSSFGGYFTDASGGEKILVDELDPVIFFTIDTMKVGSISPPMQFRMDDGSQALRILFYKNKILPHLGNLKEDYQRFRTFALNKKQSEILDNWFEITKSEVFITIDDEYNTCNLTN